MSPIPTADIVICGAGISGVSAAYHLAVRHGIKNIILVDERDPLSFTSDKSTEAYRNWWPGPGSEMIHFMNRSIDLLEELAQESGNLFGLNRRGYVFLTGREEKARQMEAAAREISALGAGELRIHTHLASAYTPSPAEGFQHQPTGADLVLSPALIQKHFPFITDEAVAMLHTRRCGWLSAQTLGMYLLEQARAYGVQLVRGRVTGVGVENGRIASVTINHTQTIHTGTFINTAGPFLRDVGRLIGIDLPVFNELHGKISFRDTAGVISRDAPLMIWEDPVHLFWTEEEREDLAADPETRWLIEQFPAGVHFRPEGAGDSPIILVLWTYHLEKQAVVEHPAFPPEYPEIVMRGLVRMVPGLARYLGTMSPPWVDGGYYCKTQENRPLIGPLPVTGAYVFGAVSGYGIMASQAGADLLAAHVTGSALPDYAPAFSLARYDDPQYQNLLAHWDATTGQL